MKRRIQRLKFHLNRTSGWRDMAPGSWHKIQFKPTLSPPPIGPRNPLTARGKRGARTKSRARHSLSSNHRVRNPVKKGNRQIVICGRGYDNRSPRSLSGPEWATSPTLTTPQFENCGAINSAHPTAIAAQ